MNEDHKIEEAEYFLARLAIPDLELREFSYELSAFLTAARSALQYALDEARSKSGGQAWYDGRVVASTAVGFFKDKRDVSVHATPVIPSRTFHVRIEEGIHFGDSVSVEIRKPDGTVIPDPQPEVSEGRLPREITLASASSSVTFHFSDWPGTEDVISLCRSYVQQVRDIVLDGRSRGFVS